MDSVPMIVLCGQTITPMLGKDAFQEADVTGITYPVVKHSYLVKNAADIPRVMKEAFHIATTGRPGPVLIDLPKDVTQGPCTAPFVDEVICRATRPRTAPETPLLEKTADLLAKSQAGALRRPRRGHLKRRQGRHPALAEKLRRRSSTRCSARAPSRGPTRCTSACSACTAPPTPTRRSTHCDLIMAIGARWDDRITGKLDEFCPTPSRSTSTSTPAEFGKIIRPTSPRRRRQAGRRGPDPARLRSTPRSGSKEMHGWRKPTRFKYPKKGGLRAQQVLDRLDKLGGRDCIITTDVGQHQMWAAQFCRTDQEPPLDLVGRRRDDGLRLPGGDRRAARLTPTRRCGRSSATAASR
jgi:acetolactate synthase-1/2/3 large subunit